MDPDSVPRKKQKLADNVSDLFGKTDFYNYELKPDHLDKPIWVCPNGHVFLEAHSPIYQQITDFLIAIAEPVSRPEHVHEYIITRYSLYAAVSVKLDTDYIISVLQTYCKTVNLPSEVIEFIQENTAQYGKAKLVLKHNRYYIESVYEGVLDDLLQIQSVRAAKDSVQSMIIESGENHIEDVREELDRLRDAENVEIAEKVESFEINPDMIEIVRRDCHDENFPLLEEYDFMNDTKNIKLEIDLKPSTHIRSYQEKSLSKMFSNGRARSGVIVLPCGSGKTLVGITAVCTIKHRAIVLCTSGVAVEQWKRQFEMWSTVNPANIIRFTATSKDRFPENQATIVISTYSMMGFQGKRSAESQELYDKLKNHEWGLLVMDEVQVVPADMFRKVIFEVKSHCKLGLTATLVREDERIEDLNFLIGPKLYEANWLDMQNLGHIARVQCIEVWCPMTAEFFQEYLSAKPRKKILLYVANPNKLMTCQYLVKKHEAVGDKIIIFSDNLFVLELYSKALKLPVISGQTSQDERMRILYSFENTSNNNVILVSKVADNSIDLPGANVIIQISSHFGSRRQEAQRLGRILRPKTNMVQTSEFNASFYSLVSQDTQEMWYADKRQQFLIDQGYSYKVMNIVNEVLADSTLRFSNKNEQKSLLERLLQAKDIDDEANEDPDDITPETISRKTGDLSKLSGQSGSYALQKKSMQRHKMFRMRYKKFKPGT